MFLVICCCQEVDHLLIKFDVLEQHKATHLLQELKEIAATEAVKGKHFFLESDIKGPSLKHDHTGRAILTVSFF